MPPESGAEAKGGGLVTLPTGTVTFLFSDIEGSTQRWESHRDAMRAAAVRHDAIMRTAIESHGGVVFKTVGDAFCAAFSRTSDALAAALEAQHLLNKEDFADVDGLRVRMGVHTGEADERDGDYFGSTLNRVARLVSIGHGGQVLLSEATRCAIASETPANTILVDLGLRRLKDLTQPEHVWQLSIAGLPAEFPPLNSLDARPNNLPVQLTSLLGRERDLDDVRVLIGAHHLVTLSGSGGVGKTRVALQVGADLIDRYANGVWFADLAPIRDSELVSSVIAKSLSISPAEGRRLNEAISDALKRKQLLLILDNCEHVLETTAALADSILAAAPDVRILATSRQPLGIGGEIVHRLPSLAVPDVATTITADETQKYGAVALFVERAKAADTRFVLTNDTAPIVAEICRRLDGIPLAIELAAARVNVLSIRHLAQHLIERFRILTGGSRTALPRQKTLTALIGWSYDLLTLQEQALFNRVGIFAGGFSLDAATAICGGEGIDEADLLDLLSSLTDKSLVVAETGAEHERYHLLETTRAYALEKLTAKREREQLARRHAEYFRGLAQAADECRGEMSEEAWLDQAGLELDNFRGALEWALSQRNDAVLGGAIAGALGIFWRDGGLPAEGRRWVGAALERIDEAEHPGIVALLWLALAPLCYGERDYEAAERARALCATLDDRPRVARALMYIAFSLFTMGRMDEAADANERALAACRELKNRRNVAYCLAVKAGISSELGHFDAGRRTYAEALTALGAIKEERGFAVVLMDLADLEFAAGNPTEALGYVAESRDTLLRGRTSLDLAQCYINSVAYNIALGHIDAAHEAAREGLRLGRKAQSALQVAFCIQHLAVIIALRGEAQRAARLRGFVDIGLRELGIQPGPTEKWSYQKLTALLSERLSEAEIAKFAAEGAAWSEDQAVEEALKV